MSHEPTWLRAEAVMAIHRRQTAEHGGDPGIRDRALLDSALARPRNRPAYRTSGADLAALAAAYAFGIARNHPFVDGNKRTALVACRTFLRVNGVDLAAPPDGKYLTFVRLAEGRLSEAKLAAWIRARLTAAPAHE